MSTKQEPWYKQAWFWFVAIAVFVLAQVVWLLSRRRNPWAAQKILEHQVNAEKQIAKITQRTNQRIKTLDANRKAEREKLMRSEQRQIARVRKNHEQLSSAALKKKMLEDLDDPL